MCNAYPIESCPVSSIPLVSWYCHCTFNFNVLLLSYCELNVVVKVIEKLIMFVPWNGKHQIMYIFNRNLAPANLATPYRSRSAHTSVWSNDGRYPLLQSEFQESASTPSHLAIGIEENIVQSLLCLSMHL